jgi:adhesin transport system membrane fusion protein
MKKRLNEKDLEFISSLSAAILNTTPTRYRILLFIFILIPASFIIWANYAMIDEITRGNGEIIPSAENQMIQNLEGGIVEEILIHEGQEVKKNQILLKINNQKSKSSFDSNIIKANSIQAKIIRLKSESTLNEFSPSPEFLKIAPDFIENEKSLYLTNKNKLNSQLNVLKNKLKQKKQELSEIKSKEKSLNSSLKIIKKEIEITQPMVIKGIKSKIDFLKLKREENDVQEKYNSTKLSIPRIKYEMDELQNNIQKVKYEFQSNAKIKLNEAITELKSIQVDSIALEDKVIRTYVKAPMNGIVQKLYTHTVGGVIKPGENIVEIVPSGQALIVEVQIKPADIAFIFFNQKAIVKFSAYDFAIYGGLEGKVISISPDTIKNEKNETFYTIRIKTTKNFLQKGKQKFRIIPGMTVSVDIITGKKSILDYILKPILKTKQYTFTEK